MSFLKSTNFRIGLIQTELHWQDPAANRRHFQPKLQALADADLIVLPEMFSTGFSMASTTYAESMTDTTVTWLQTQATDLNTAICGSLMIKENNHFYNRFIMCAPNQEPITYDKHHLFRMADEQAHFSPGTTRVVFELKGIRICPQICYDLRFPVFSRNRDDYELLMFVANWPARRHRHWRALLTARAIENQSYVVGVNRIGSDGNNVEYCGDSGLIHPDGHWIADLTDTDTHRMIELDLEDLQQYRQSFPAWQDADDFSLG
ncbi:MAG: putative amidohydrolase [Candidatus Azotimanducaceae bacterium]|jgi:predicted amidohydrolase